MATDLIVIGSGVSGLTSAICLAEAGYRVRIWARDQSYETTSNVAAAVWYPYKAFPEDLVLGWSAQTYATLVQLAGWADTGVLDRSGIELFREPVTDPWWRDAVPDFRRAGPAELPDGFADGYCFSAPVIEMPIYLGYLLRRFQQAGGSIDTRNLASLEPALDAATIVIDCAGLGARELVADQSLSPIRGQIVKVGQVGLTHFVFDDHGPGGVTYIVPRANDIILGGTAQAGDEDTRPDPATADAILARCIALEPRLAHAPVLGHKVGLRPGRPTVRLEAEQHGNRVVIHNYGHGGAGVTLSWGCARQVLELVTRWHIDH